MIAQPNSPLDASVLVLNRMYMAVHVIPARRAFCLLCKEVAEIVHIEDGSYAAYDFETWLEVCDLRESAGERESEEDWITSVNFSVQVPRIIRLLKYDRVPTNTVKFSRRNVFLRDDYRCQYCARKLSSSGLSLDHVHPRSQGGETSWVNIVTACLKCNVRKGGRTPGQANMKLLSQPVRPKRNPALSYQLNSGKYESWRSFLK
jgi:5-methylcytosine-specific restriction endonuclease McrA